MTLYKTVLLLFCHIASGVVIASPFDSPFLGWGDCGGVLEQVEDTLEPKTLDAVTAFGYFPSFRSYGSHVLKYDGGIIAQSGLASDGSMQLNGISGLPDDSILAISGDALLLANNSIYVVHDTSVGSALIVAARLIKTNSSQKVKAIASGGAGFGIAMLEDSTVVGWGRNDFGQTTIPPTLSQVVAIGAGLDFGVALKVDGTVLAWGQNKYSQSSPPDSLNHVRRIAVGADFSVALKQDSTLVVWGKMRACPRAINQVVDVTAAISCDGDWSNGDCFNVVHAKRADGSIWSWSGEEYTPVQILPDAARFRFLGGNFLTDSSNKLFVLDSFGRSIKSSAITKEHAYKMYRGFPDVSEIAIGGAYNSKGIFLLVRKTNGEVFQYGDITIDGKQDKWLWGDDFAQITAGSAVGIALGADGSIMTKGGRNGYGYRTPEVISKYKARKVIASTSLIDGLRYGLAAGIFDSGVVRSWKTDTYTYPETVYEHPRLLGSVKLAWGPKGLIGLREDGTLVSDSGDTPQGLAKIKDLVGNGRAAFVLLEDGSIRHWGDSKYAEIPSSLTGIRSIAMGSDHVLLLKESGELIAYGGNAAGQVPPGMPKAYGINAGETCNIAYLKELPIGVAPHAPYSSLQIGSYSANLLNCQGRISWKGQAHWNGSTWSVPISSRGVWILHATTPLGLRTARIVKIGN